MTTVEFVIYKASENDAANGYALQEGEGICALIVSAPDSNNSVSLRLFVGTGAIVPLIQATEGTDPGQYASLAP